MNFNLVDIIIVCSFILPLVVAYKRKFNIIRIKNSIEELEDIYPFSCFILKFYSYKKDRYNREDVFNCSCWIQ